MALASWTDAQVVGQLNSGAKWTGSTITYSFPTSTASLYTGSGESGGFRAFTDAQKPMARLALQLWDDLIAPDMMEVSPGTSWSSANIELAFSNTNVGYAHAYFPSAGSVWFNQNYSSGTNSLTAPVVGRHGFLTYVHELGHSMGLEHMGEYNGSQTDGPSSFQDSTVYSVMSYYGPSWGTGSANGEGLVAWADWVGADGVRYAPQTPMVNDIMAIQEMYGVETTTRTGDTIYGFNSNVTGAAASIFNFATNKNPVLTIFDSAGIDTLDLSGYATPSTIDLAPGAASSANAMTLNIWIARTATIENAKGGSGADLIRGNEAANVLTGNGGNDQLFGFGGDDTLIGGAGSDRIDGGAGNDTVVFDAIWSGITIVYDSATQTFSFSGSGWTDTVVNVETFVDSAAVRRTAEDLTGGATPPPPPPAPSGTEVSIAAVTASVAEGNGGTSPNILQFRVALAAAAASAETVSWSLSGGTATAADFSSATSGILSFAAGETEKIISLSIVGDTVTEANEAVRVVLSSPTSGLVLGTAAVTATILNDDAAPPAPSTLTGTSSNNTLIGTAAADIIYGLGGSDTLYGRAGDDIIDGGSGKDKMYGEQGNDIYYVDHKSDVIVEVAGAGSDTVRTALSSYTLAANVENLEYSGSGSFAGTGNALDNVMRGGSGSDTLNGGLGHDRLFGGSGSDSFNFTSALSSSNIDTILDFNTAADTIRIDNVVFKAFSKTGALASSAFVTGTAAADADDRIIFDRSTGSLFYDADGTGFTSAIKFATLDLAGLSGTVASSDFVII